ncbi:hypothetical protein ACK3TF_001300 [Chlorella vulgaris]
MTRLNQNQLRLALGSLSLLLLCAHPCVATPACAALGLACSASPPPPPPPPGDCLADGTEWTYSAIAECCSGYAFGAYCGCLPVGATIQNTAVECCSRNSDGSSPDNCIAPCVQKSGVCDQCIGRRRSLQGVPVMQCNCCTGMMCANNSTNTGSVCAGPPSDPDFGEITATPTGGNAYTLDIALIASNDTGAVGVGIMEYAISASYAAGGYAFSTGGAPTSPLTYSVVNIPCGTSYSLTVTATNDAYLSSGIVTRSSLYSTPTCFD